MEKLAVSFAPTSKNFEEVIDSNKKLTKVFKRTNYEDGNNQPALQNSQSQIPKLVSASDELVKTFSKMKNSKTFFKQYEIPKVLFHGMDMIPLHLEEIEFESMTRTIV